MEKTVDLRGLVCPEPVLRTKKLLDDAAVMKVEALVETEINVGNLKRLAGSLKMRFQSQPESDFFRVVLERSDDAPTEPTTSQRAHEHVSAQAMQKIDNTVGTVVLITKETFGTGDPEFSANLLNLFLQTLLQAGHTPRAILMANTGVKLLDPDAPTLKVLNDFKDAGADVLACGLCVDYYGLKGKIPTEQITNMFAICEYLMAADKVIQP
jgi:selenium metabolism protein YedF